MERRNEYVAAHRSEIYKMAQVTQKTRVNKESDDETTRSVDEDFRNNGVEKGLGMVDTATPGACNGKSRVNLY